MPTTQLRNWGGNLTFTPSELLRPTSVDQLQRLVTRHRKIHALGTGHSFSPVADSPGVLVSVVDLPKRIEIDRQAMTVTVSAGLRYGEVSRRLHQAGLALPNLGSLPHICVAGACATGTHGSGDVLPVLASSVTALEMVTATGDLLRAERTDERFAGMVVALGSLGIVTSLTLEVIPAFDLGQRVYQGLPWEAALDSLDTVFASGYSVSMFTSWQGGFADQVWVKASPDADADDLTALGAVASNAPLHMIPGLPAENCTDQSGSAGPWFERLPHFRADHTPSSGEELQSEYLVDRRSGVAALEAVRRMGEQITPVLQVSEIRTVAADDLWLSPAFGRKSLAIHFTWVPDTPAVMPVVAAIENALEPFEPRPHWGKVFTTPPANVAARHPRLAEFRSLAGELDPNRCFSNSMIDAYLLGEV